MRCAGQWELEGYKNRNIPPRRKKGGNYFVLLHTPTHDKMIKLNYNQRIERELLAVAKLEAII